MKCKLCDRNTQCPCKGGGCPQCKQSNPQVEYTNKVIDLWTEKHLILENLESMKLWQRLRIDPYLIWDKLTNKKDFPEEVEDAIKNNKTLGSTVAKNKISNAKFRTNTFVVTENPNEFCEYEPWMSPRRKCIFCGSIFRYHKNLPCPAFKLNKEENDV